MIEGNGFDSPEAGPSSRRRPSYDDDQTPQMNGVSRMRDGDGDEEEEEVLRDEEVNVPMRYQADHSGG